MEKVFYVAPELEVIEVMVEQGFQSSEVDSGIFPGEGSELE